MPSITLHQLSYTTPDNQPLFDRLDIAFGPGRTGLVGRNGTGKSTLLKLITGDLPPTAGSVAVDGTLGMLHQNVQVADGARIADAMHIAAGIDRLDRLESGNGSLEDAGDADWTLPGRYETALATLGLPAYDPHRQLSSLSGGQRTRLALAGLILAQPDFILLDEPTNNLDSAGRIAIADLLSAWRGGAIVVSHDRDLLRQMDMIVELTTLGASTYGGNWDHYTERKALELASAEHRLGTAERQVVDIDRRIQAQVERKARRDSAGRKKRARGDTPKLLLNAMANRAEGTSGQNARLANRMRAEAAQSAEAARADIEVLQPIDVTLASTGLPSGKLVLEATGLTGGYSDHPILQDLNLRITGPERIALTGPNGSGKTTALRLLIGALAPMAGTVRLPARHALLDQSVSLLDPGQSIRENYRRLNPDDTENACRAALARFKFRADAALQSVATLSGGEMLRAGLAATIGSTNPPELLILDEPTNHLDIEAIEAVEAGLRAYDGALVVVSHDRAFLDAIAIDREISLESGQSA